MTAGTIDDTLASFARGNVAFCNIDQPMIGRSLTPTEHVTSSLGYVRLHGRNYKDWFNSDDRNDRYNYLYSESELGGWREKIESVAEKAQTTYVITNNHYRRTRRRECAGVEIDAGRQARESATELAGDVSGVKKIRRPRSRGWGSEFVVACVVKSSPRRHRVHGKSGNRMEQWQLWLS